MLTTEHAALQSARAGTITEATGRTLLFVSATSAAIFGLGIMAQMSPPGPTFFAFALLLLPGLCVLGVETFMRVLVLLIEDETYGRGIDQVRRYYVEHAPSIGPYLFVGPTCHANSVLAEGHTGFSSSKRMTTLANLVGVVTSMLAGLLAALAAIVAFGGRIELATVCGLLACSTGIVFQRTAQYRAWQRAQAWWTRRLQQLQT